MNQTYIDTASRIFAALYAAKRASREADERLPNPAKLATSSFEMARVFMIEYEFLLSKARAEIQKMEAENPGAIPGTDYEHL